jgi:tRNA(Leu) C34 or U34 (ribose-2'-O)-methylase TrmL
MLADSTQLVIVGLSNPKSPANVGSVMRAAGCYGVDGVRYSGKRYDRAMQYQTDTHNAASKIPLERVNSLIDNISPGIKIVCVEFALGATSLPEFIHPPQALYLFGPEDGSLSQEILDQADAVVYIPTVGCMNLAATVNVVLYDRLAKSGVHIDHSKSVLMNRDVNNRLVVKGHQE